MTTVKSGAAPCADCGTQGGYVRPRESRPGRWRGLCSNCWQHHEAAGTLDRFLHYHRDYRKGLRSRAERKAEKEAIIAARIALHEARDLPGFSGPRPAPVATKTAAEAAWRCAVYQQQADDWLAEHQEYTARWVREEPAA